MNTPPTTVPFRSGSVGGRLRLDPSTGLRSRALLAWKACCLALFLDCGHAEPEAQSRTPGAYPKRLAGRPYSAWSRQPPPRIPRSEAAAALCGSSLGDD